MIIKKRIIGIILILVFSIVVISFTGCCKEKEKNKEVETIQVNLQIIDPETGNPFKTGIAEKITINHDENFEGFALRFNIYNTDKYLQDKDVSPKTLNDFVEVSYSEGDAKTIGGDYKNWPKNIGKYNVTVTFNVCFWTCKTFGHDRTMDKRFTVPRCSFILEII